MEDARADLELRKIENRNISWLNSPGVYFTYVLLLIVARLIIGALDLGTATAWTTWHVSHSVITFFAFHWRKGVPFGVEGSHQGKYSTYTVWEQIDSGVQYTPTRKYLTLVPIVLFLITSHYTNYHARSLVINTIAFAIVLIAKAPFMNKKRIFGINSGYQQ